MSPVVVTVTLNPALDKTVTVEKFKFGSLNRVTSLSIDAGGKGINVAKVLNRFGIDVVATGLIAGNQGNLLLNLLEKDKINAQFLKISGDTRTNLKIVDDTSNITTEVNESGFYAESNNLIQFKDKLVALLRYSTFLILSGSLPRGVSDELYAHLIQLARTNGVRTILDADGLAFETAIKAIPYAVKPNLHELEELFGKKLTNISEILQSAKVLQKSGIEIVVVSMGENGALLVGKEEAWKTNTFPIVPMSTVAAGDSMVAALVYSFLNNYSLKETAKLITASGTITASKPGTQVCSLDEVLQSFNKVELEKLEIDKFAF